MFLKVKVFPEAKEDKLVWRSGDSAEAHVRAKAEKGAANSAVRFLLAMHYKMPSAAVRIVKGGTSRSKIFDIPVDAGSAKP